ncbi:MAG: cation:proton antiporter [Chloroflexi bacterium]|nr:cation:proton antiporter [Chloroflexota bacterium]
MSAEETVALLALSLSAFAAPLVAGRLGLPGAVVEIAFGATLVAVLGPLGRGELVHALAEIGFALLMFLAGMEIDFDSASRAGRRWLAFSILAVVAIFVGAVAGASRLGLDPFFALLGGAVSIGVAVAALRERGLLRAPVGQAVLLVGGLGELATIVFLALFTVYTKHGPGLTAIRELGGLVLLFICAWVLLIALRELVWWFPHRFARLVQSHDPAEIGTRAALALLFAFVGLASALRVEMILATFLAGAAFGFVFRQKAALEGKLNATGFGFFIPAFFVSVGFGTRLGDVARPEHLALVGQIAAVSFLARAPVWPLLRLAGLRWRPALGATLFLAAPLTLLVAIATAGRELGRLDGPTATAIVFYATLSGFLYPILGRAALDSREEPGGKQPAARFSPSLARR